MIYFADLHIHSRFSRATSRNCNLRELAHWAALKGIKVLATGDFTHPGWTDEIREILQPEGDGLFRLKNEYVPQDVVLPGGFGPADVRFILNVEISSIYKKAGATRKVHNLVFMPDLESMQRFNARLEKIGNIKSDGRPILGLDSRDLLETALETTSDSFMIPAHVWTPWFSILGSKSGFDSVEECFGDLTPHIFALETGLSSDPEMNYRVTTLDAYTLISNSDTHSPAKLGREANIFAGTPGYTSIREALRRGPVSLESGWEADVAVGSIAPSAVDNAFDEGFVGTIEFFPEEGKYHLDGHRKCSARLDPEDTVRHGGKCPVCGSPVTVGVMSRVIELSDRESGTFPEKAAPFWRMIPLEEIIAQAVGVGPHSKKVQAQYLDMLERLGPELTILWSLPLEHIGRHQPEIIVEAIRRVRKGALSIQPGFDGEYGKVEIFAPGERAQFGGQQSFVSSGGTPRARKKRDAGPLPVIRKKDDKSVPSESAGPDDALNEEQLRAVHTWDRPVLVQAGPGTGKTRTLTHRIAALVNSHLATPGEITAVTFTRKAASAMRDRLARLLPPETAEQCWVGTFHQLGARILETVDGGETGRSIDKVLSEDEALKLFRQAADGSGIKLAPGRASCLFAQVSLLKQNLVKPGDEIDDHETAAAYRAYEGALRESCCLDLDDLVTLPVRLLQTHPDHLNRFRDLSARYLLIDEFQDVNTAQYEMVRLLGGKDGSGLFAIGDPDQAIYGFRGADWRFFSRFGENYPHTSHVRLTRNYRSQACIIEAAEQVLDRGRSDITLEPVNGVRTPIKIARLTNPFTEAKFISETIESMLGGSSFFAMDSGILPLKDGQLGFRDFAVLFRLNAVGDALEEALQASGIPYQRAIKSRPEDEAEAMDPRAEAVSLMTIHASKGLEFPVVFIAGCEDGIIPYLPEDGARSLAADMDEERRLLYVAMTRAAGELYVTRSVNRSLFGRRVAYPESRFLKTVHPSACEMVDSSGRRKSALGQRLKQCELF